ncbi:hypothetical protein MEO_02796, partial [Candida albicans P94015]
MSQRIADFVSKIALP